jgi:putative hydrolase of the HAD superfamily
MHDRPALDAVVLDAGGTLVRLDFEWMSDAIADLGQTVTPLDLRLGEVEGRRRYDASRGSGAPVDPRLAPLGVSGDNLAYFTGILEAAKVRPRHIAALLERFLERQRATGLWTRPAEGARAALDALGASGLRVACVSNSDGRAELHLSECGMRDGLEFVVDSAIEGVEKPDPRIFHIALDRLGVAPRRAAYVGDIRSVDEVGARAADMHFVLIDPFMEYGDGGLRIVAIRDLPDLLAQSFTLPPPRAQA